jgi:hypothetical protein
MVMVQSVNIGLSMYHPRGGSDWCWILRPPVPLRCTGGYNIGSPSGLGMQTRFIEFLINMDLASKPQGEINLTPTGVAQCHSPLCSVAERGVPMASIPISSPGAEYGFSPISKHRFDQCITPERFRLVVDPETPVPLRCTGGYNIGSPSGLCMQTRFIEF